MKKLLKSIFILIIIFFASCEKKINDFDFEKNVMSEILPSIIDSTCVDIRIYSDPPPKYGELKFNKVGKCIGIDSTKATSEEKLRLADWKKKIAEIEKDSVKIIIAFDPKIKPYKKEFDKIVVENFPNDTLYKIKEDKSKEYILNFKSIKLNGNFKLKNINEFEKENIFERKYQFNFSGILRVSGIQFDEKQENGILEVGFICGGECGYGNKIYIRKVKNKWEIIKVERTWIA
jgi:hypothetical protein